MNTSSPIIEDYYKRQRLQPQPGDPLYVHLSDLKLFLDDCTQADYGRLLDYGCGGSPYRGLFKANEYLRADFTEFEGLDYKIGNDGKLAIADQSFDTVLSTQVLEHVFSPEVYLKEAWRILRPGGRLILSTHGVWQDHGCPYDFRRWTADGLKLDLANTGFEVQKICKITTGPRATAFLFFSDLARFVDSRKTLAGWAFWLLRQSCFASTAKFGAWADQRFPLNRVVSSEIPGHDLYLTLGVIAQKRKNA